MEQKNEKQRLEEKERYYNKKKILVEQRMILLRKSIESGNLDDLKKNSTELEILDWDATLEGIISYWEHYNERLREISVRQELLTNECEKNYQKYYDMFTTIHENALKQYSNQLQEQHSKIMSVINNWKTQEGKNAMYSLIKEILLRMKKI